jgi:hypothetical protein
MTATANSRLHAQNCIALHLVGGTIVVLLNRCRVNEIICIDSPRQKRLDEGKMTSSNLAIRGEGSASPHSR